VCVRAGLPVGTHACPSLQASPLLLIHSSNARSSEGSQGQGRAGQ